MVLNLLRWEGRGLVLLTGYRLLVHGKKALSCSGRENAGPTRTSPIDSKKNQNPTSGSYRRAQDSH